MVKERARENKSGIRPSVTSASGKETIATEKAK